MSEIKTNWSKPEFKAYLMLYAANANYFESEEEVEMIKALVSKDAYKTIHREFDKDNDYQSIQKILFTIDKYGYSINELNHLVDDIKELFNADGEFDILEENMLRAIKNLLR